MGKEDLPSLHALVQQFDGLPPAVRSNQGVQFGLDRGRIFNGLRLTCTHRVAHSTVQEVDSCGGTTETLCSSHVMQQQDLMWQSRMGTMPPNADISTRAPAMDGDAILEEPLPEWAQWLISCK